ncbi:molybdopterin-dependent oxidoreductase [Chloroflexota bacterium]
MGRSRIVPTSCGHDCGGRCVLKVHVDEDRIVRIESDDDEEPQLRACLRGRAYRQRVYTAGRLQYPMKRTGPRGEGSFERISWDEALDEVATELIRVRENYGNASILMLVSGGSQSILHAPMAIERLLALFGGYTRPWGIPSFEGALFASMATYGTLTTGSSREDLLNSRMIILWGWNPAATIWDTNTSFTLIKARESGTRIVSVDPRFTESTAAFANEWIPIKPGTDAAMLIAMAYVMIRDSLYDRDFLNTYTVGFDKFQSYVIGSDDGIPKSPGWAEEITGVPAATIEQLAKEYATIKPAALIPGWGPARTAMGEQFGRAANTLIAMTGNIGINGGFAGGFMRAFHSRQIGMPRGTRNLVEQGSEPRRDSLYKLHGAGFPSAARIHWVKIYDAIQRGKAGGYPCDPKLAYIAATNPLCSYPDANRGISALKRLEFIVCHEQRMTPTARFADILLPVSTFMERDDIITPWLGAPYYLYMNKVIEPMYECKSDWDICAELAPRLGITDYRGGRTNEEWLKLVTEGAGDILDYDEFKRNGVAKLRESKPFVAFSEQIKDPSGNSFPTLSGKIEIYCELLAEMNNPLLPPIPKYIPAPEGPGDSLSWKYPLQLITTHFKAAAHSTLEGTPWLEEVEPRLVWINTSDSESRGIADGDDVLVFNDRGKLMARARVTERIMPGVVDIPEGAWFALDEEGVDEGGCANTLTRAEHSPAGAWATNTSLVEVVRAYSTVPSRPISFGAVP